MKRHRDRLGSVGSYYHVYARGLDRKPIFHDDRDRRTFLMIPGHVIDLDARCLAYSLLDNHKHLVLRPLAAPITDVMHRINLRYALHHNRRHGGVGYVYQGRFQSVLIEDDVHLRTAIAYVHLNPVLAGCVDGEAALRHFEWTGHGAQMGYRPNSPVEVESVLALFGKTRVTARRALGEFLRATHAKKRGVPHDGFALYEGDTDFVPVGAREAEDLGARGLRGVLGDSHRVYAEFARRNARLAIRVRLRQEGWDVQRLLSRVAQLLRVSAAPLRAGSRRRSHSQARAVFLHFAVEYLGASSRESGSLVQVSGGGVARARQRGAESARDLGLSGARVFAARWLDEN